jgi:hypothetical protein
MIKSVINSLRLNIISEVLPKIIISADGYDQPNLEYQQFLNNLRDQYQSDSSIQVVVNPKKGHLTGNIRNSIQYVDTKYILMIQHDLVLIKKVNLDNLIQDMEDNPRLKHVRFNKRSNIKAGWDNTPLFGSDNIRQNYHYILTESWSDQNHVSTKEYYLNQVLSKVEDGVFMEQVMNSICKGQHQIFGTYVFGELDEDRYIVHVDGANTRGGNLGKQCRRDRDYYLNLYQ